MRDAKHPCFNGAAGGQWGRIHLPVAPDCNISCAYCSRKTDCPNESRPGVCSRVLSPEEAAERVETAVRRMPSLAVVGIAGPGDPLANAECSLRTFELVRRRHPGLLLCLSTNGLLLADYAADLKSLGVGHITVTINAVDPAVAVRIYRAARMNACSYRGREAAEILLAKQAQALASLERYGFAVKINTVVLPGVNDGHVEEIARFAAGFKVDMMNCIGLIPVRGTALSDVSAPTAERMEALRERAGKYVFQMRHCTRCRADAFGLLGRDERIDDSPEGWQDSRSSADCPGTRCMGESRETRSAQRAEGCLAKAGQGGVISRIESELTGQGVVSSVPVTASVCKMELKEEA